MRLKINVIPKMIVYINVILSIVLYCLSPMKYNTFFLIAAMIIYLSSFLSYLWKTKLKNYFCFEFIFSIIYFFVYYFYPVFLYPFNKYALFMFNYKYDERVITKSTLLATIGYCIFVAGLSSNKKVKIKKEVNVLISNLIPTIGVGMCCFVDIIRYWILNLGIYFGEGSSDPNSVSIWGYIAVLQHTIIFSAITIEFYNLINNYKGKKWYLHNPVLWMLILIDMICIASTGSRGKIINIGLVIIMGSILCGENWSIKKVFLGIASGIIAMNLIMVWRHNGDFSFDLINLSTDLTINNFTLYKGYEYVMNNGIKIFTILGSLSGAIPFLQGFLLRIFKIPIYEASSARFFSYLTLGSNASYGVGTNIIASLYLGTGFLGVCFFMYLLSRIVKRYAVYCRGESVFKLLLCFEIMAQSVYIVRADFFYPVQKIIYSMIFLWLYLSFFNKNKLQNNL